MASEEKKRAPNGAGKRSVVMRSRVEQVLNALAIIESAVSYVEMKGRVDGRAFRQLRQKTNEVYFANSVIGGSDLVPEALKARASSISNALILAVHRSQPLDKRREQIETDSEGVTPGMKRYLETLRASAK